MSAHSTATTDWAREVRRFVEAGGNTTHAFGLGRMIGRLYAWLYLSPGPVPLEDLAANLSVSKASASIVVRQLAALQAVRQVWIPGDRRDFYEAETNFSTILREGLLPGIRKKLHSAGTQIKRTLSTTTTTHAANGAEADFTRDQMAELRRRLKTAQALHKRLDGILANKLLSRFL